MTEPKACLPGCTDMIGPLSVGVDHAWECPNHSRFANSECLPERPNYPKCAECGEEEWLSIHNVGKFGFPYTHKFQAAPKASEAPKARVAECGCPVGGSAGLVIHNKFCKPAPAPEPKQGMCAGCGHQKHGVVCMNFASDNECPCKAGEPKQGSEEEAQMMEDFGPPDHEAAYRDAVNIVTNYEPQECTDEDLNNSRAYLALRAEVEELKARNADLTRAIEDEASKKFRCENDALRADLAAEKARADRAEELLVEADSLYRSYGLVAGRIEGDPMAAGRWANKVSDLLASAGRAEEEKRELLRPFKPAPAPEPKQGSEEPILPVTELEAEKSTSKILRALLAKAEAERDEARATKDMHKERQEKAWAEVDALRAELAAEKARADRAEERVKELEDVIADVHQAGLTGNPAKRHLEVGRAILAARARKEGGI